VAPVQIGPWHFFSNDEGPIIDALADRIIPADAATPGGKDLAAPSLSIASWQARTALKRGFISDLPSSRRAESRRAVGRWPTQAIPRRAQRHR
jgi:hypothetical protein